jgi:hypothetical protein
MPIPYSVKLLKEFAGMAVKVFLVAAALALRAGEWNPGSR